MALVGIVNPLNPAVLISFSVLILCMERANARVSVLSSLVGLSVCPSFVNLEGFACERLSYSGVCVFLVSIVLCHYLALIPTVYVNMGGTKTKCDLVLVYLLAPSGGLSLTANLCSFE